MTSTAYPPHLLSHQDTEAQREGEGLEEEEEGEEEEEEGEEEEGEGGEETHVRVSIDTRRGGAQRN